MKRLPPALGLFFLAPAIGELLSGSAPPPEFFHPFTLILLSALYGSGAILTRELALRWGKGWPSILLLGAAYGIVEEGLMVKSFFDPAWPDLGLLGVYGRWAGVNWVWSLFLTLYHAVFSIAIPIFLVEQMYPARRKESWIGERGFRGLAILLTLDVIFGFALLTSFRPPAVPYLGACAAAAALFWAARRAPTEWRDGAEGPRRPIALGLLGFLGTTIFFLMNWLLPELSVPVEITLLLEAGWVALILFLVRRASGYGAWKDDGRLALVSGALTFFILLAPLSELDAARPDNTAGMTLVGLAATAFLFWLRRKVRRRLSSGVSASHTS
jgi:hypothetical protein